MKTKKAFEIIVGDVILFNQRPFVINIIDKFFKNDKVAEKYPEGVDDDEIAPEDQLYSFYNEIEISDEGLIDIEIDQVKHDREFYYLGQFEQLNSIEESRTIPKTLRFKILDRDQFKCVKCGRGAIHGITLHIDHIIPFSLGGKSDKSNLQTLCEDCNLGKRNRSTK